MDREKLNKRAIIAAANYDNPFDEPAYDKKFYDGFMACADWLMQQPLSEKLTDEEKEKICYLYHGFNSFTEDERCLPFMGISLTMIMATFESIFGADLFKEK